MDKKDAELQWKLTSRTPLYSGFYQIDQCNYRYQRFDGNWSKPIQRELFVRKHVAAVLPYDPALDSVLLIKQFRVGAIETSQTPWLLEVIAGMCEPSENPMQVAIREANEEAGLTLDQITPITSYLASPGSTNETVFLYYAESDLSSAGGIHGLDCEDEDIEVSVIPSAQAFELLDQNVINNALTMIALQWLRLRLNKA